MYLNSITAVLVNERSIFCTSSHVKKRFSLLKKLAVPIEIRLLVNFYFPLYKTVRRILD